MMPKCSATSSLLLSTEALRAAAIEKEEKLGAISGGMSLPGIL